MANPLKRLLLGRPIASEQAGHHLLPKILALPVFASDALSSNAYATEEILHVLVLAGTGALGISLPIAGAVAILLVIVVTSYRQTVRAYPRGGGSYIVTRENIGTLPGLVAAAALLADYVLTVAVSIAAGSFAAASLVPELLDHRVGLSLVFLGIITLGNLRGLKESGSVFAVPTYAFVLSIVGMLGVGMARCVFGDCPQAETAHEVLPAAQPLGLFLILRAFSSGATALTGVEAIADGVSAFRGRTPRQQADNAATTLGALGVMSISMFLGITFLANQMNVHPSEERSVVAQIAHTAFSGGLGFAIVQITTALILVLAANTAYQDFPRLSSILAKDRFMPRQFVNRGDRLAFSNGIVMLAAFAGFLIVAYDAEVSRLIQLYVVGVFTSFTLSQAGMVMRWRRLRSSEPAWFRRAVVNGIGATTTGVVLVVVAITKFTHGAWIVIVAVPLIVLIFRAISAHYSSVSQQLRAPEGRPGQYIGTRAVVLVDTMDEAALRALGYARAMRPLEVRGLHIGGGPETERLRREWERNAMGVPLDVVALERGDLVDVVRRTVRSLPRGENEFITMVLPERLSRRGWRQFLRRREGLVLKAALLFEQGVVVTNVPTIVDDKRTADPTLNGGRAGAPIAPAQILAVTLLANVHNATLRALAYSRALTPTDERAVVFNVDQDASEQVMADWERLDIDIPLEVIDSPYRGVTGPLVRYARDLRRSRPDTVVAVVIPEFVVRKWWHQFLHNQTALAIKAALLFEPGVVVTSVPFHLR